MSSTAKKETGAMEAHAKALFEDSIERVDARTRSRLTQVRHAALDELRKPARARWLWGSAGGGLVAAAVIAVLIGGWPGTDPATPAALPLEDLDIVANAENLELLQDVEFYAWFAEQSPAGVDDGAG